MAVRKETSVQLVLLVSSEAKLGINKLLISATYEYRVTKPIPNFYISVSSATVHLMHSCEHANQIYDRIYINKTENAFKVHDREI